MILVSFLPVSSPDYPFLFRFRVGKDTMVSTGNLKATVDSQGLIAFTRISDGHLLLQTNQQSFGPVPGEPALEQER